jgi:DNA-binding CsgD family transcriptional regulator
VNMFINERQFEFWKLRRSRTSNITIATNFGISRQAVSKALLTIDGKIEASLREMARANKIAIVKINPQLGVLLGRSVPLDVDAIIFVSGSHGIQVWYEHDGDCGTCAEYAECVELLWDYARELDIVLNQTADPTKMAEELFAKVKEMV